MDSHKEIARCNKVGSITDNFTILGKHAIEPTADGVIYWHIVNFSHDMPKARIILKISAAFDDIQDAFDLIKPKGRHIIFKATNDFDKAHIKIWFVKPFQKSQSILDGNGRLHEFEIVMPMDGHQGTLGYVQSDRTDVYLDDGENWGEIAEWIENVWTIRLFPVVKHEVLHALDLGHTDVKADLMYPSYDGTDKPITIDSINGLQEIWGYKKQLIANANGSYKPCPIINWEKLFFFLRK